MVTLDPTAPAARPYPPATGPRTPYHLSHEQVQFFDEHGYLILRQWIPPRLLERLRAARYRSTLSAEAGD